MAARPQVAQRAAGLHGFTGRFRISTVKIEWTARTPTFEFVSDPAGTTINVSSVIGRERNGVFFSQDGGGDD